MPTYDYACTACKKTFEIFHSMKEPAKRLCPSCGKKALERQLGTGGAIIFKGSGFYQTDYRTESYKKAADADKAPAASAAAGTGGSGGGGDKAGKEEAGSTSSTGSTPDSAKSSTPAKGTAPKPDGSARPKRSKEKNA